MKLILTALFILFSIPGWAADSKLSALSNNSAPAKTDLLYDVASGTSFNITAAQLGTLLLTPNVGIGSTTPGQALDVQGTVRAIGFIGNASLLTGFPTLNQNTTGNAATATALAANGTNCSAGNYPLGVDASGNSESCTAASTGTVTSIATTSPITGGTITGTGTIGINQSNTSTNGYLSSTDWNTFNGKQANLSLVGGTYVNGDACTYSSSGTLLNCNTALGGGGTVTSVTLATPNSTLTLGGTNPVTTSGTINADLNLSNPNIWNGQQVFNTANVGIGSTVPGQKLDVQGTVRATNFIGDSSVTYTVCASDRTHKWHCDYTATGTNDQIQINAAITAANGLTTGGHILLTEGHFYIGNNDTSITPLGNIWLQGSGMYGVTTLVGTSGLTDHAIILNTSNVQNNIRVSDLKLDGTSMRTVTWNLEQKGIEINDGRNGSVDTNIIVDHNWLYNIPSTAISTDNDPQQLITHNIMQLCGTLAPNGPGGSGSSNSGTNGFPLSSNGIGLGTLNDGTNENWVISDNICIQVADACILSEEQNVGSTSTPSYGITITGNVDYGSYNTVRISGASHVTITGNYSYNTVEDSYVVTTDTFNDTQVNNITIGDNVSFNAGRHGIYCYDPVIGDVPTNINLHHNMIYTATGSGIYSGCNSINIDHNSLVKNKLSGIYLSSPQQESNINIDSNYIDGNGSLATSGNDSGITTVDVSGKAIVNLYIKNNHIFNSSGSAQIYGIDFSGIAGTLSPVYLTDNDLSGNATSAINSWSALSVGTNIFPFNNNGYTTNNFIQGNLNVQTNVGIGSLSPGQALDVKGTIRMTGFNLPTSATNGYVLTSDSSGNGSWTVLSAGSGTVSSGTIGQEAVYTGTTMTGSGIITDNGTNVGVGTVNPTAALQIGNSASALSVNAGNIVTVGGDGNSKLTADTLQLDGNPMIFNNHTNGPMTWQLNNGSEKMRLDTNGNVGIGSTAPGSLLDVQGSVRILGANGLNIGTTAANLNYLNVGTTNQFNVSSTGVVNSGTINSTGSFLTSNTNGTMGGNSGTINSQTAFAGGASTTSNLLLRSTTGNGTTDSVQLEVGTNGSNKVLSIQDNSGIANVGIGSVNPGDTLDVQGTIRVSKLGSTLSVVGGTNGCHGLSALTTGAVTVSTTCTPSAAQNIIVWDGGGGTLANVGSMTVGTISAGTSFVCQSSNALDSSNCAWLIIGNS